MAGDNKPTYNEEHEEDEHSHKERVPETPPVRKAYTVRFSCSLVALCDCSAPTTLKDRCITRKNKAEPAAPTSSLMVLRYRCDALLYLKGERTTVSKMLYIRCLVNCSYCTVSWAAVIDRVDFLVLTFEINKKKWNNILAHAANHESIQDAISPP
jgi:L-lysine 2,3-aminomutase